MGDLSGRILVNALSPFACTGFCLLFRSPHILRESLVNLQRCRSEPFGISVQSSGSDLAQWHVRTICAYVTQVDLRSDLIPRLGTFPVTVTLTLHHYVFVALWMHSPWLRFSG